MNKFSSRSLKNLEGVHPQLTDVIHRVMGLQFMDFSVVEGVRTLERQKQLMRDGKSRTLKSKHLLQSDGYGHAVDIYPYPIDMKKVHKGDAREIYRFGVLQGLVQAVAEQMGVKIICGADWDGDGQTLDHTFFDAPHFQIVLRC